jgi:Ca2+-binding EF-hand superfamily protein
MTRSNIAKAIPPKLNLVTEPRLSHNTRLSRAVAAARAGGSSAASIAEVEAATELLTRRQSAAYVLKRRADEARVTQLRGIFAAYDEDRDGVLSSSRELPVALMALGIEPSEKMLQHFSLSSPSGNVDLSTFIRVCMAKAVSNSASAYLGSPDKLGNIPDISSEAETTEKRIEVLFLAFDPSRTGRVSLQVLLHVLAEVDSPTALTVDEIQELLKMTGILNETTMRDPRTLYSMDVDYKAFIRHLLFSHSSSTTERGVKTTAVVASSATQLPRPPPSASLSTPYYRVQTK